MAYKADQIFDGMVMAASAFTSGFVVSVWVKREDTSACSLVIYASSYDWGAGAHDDPPALGGWKVGIKSTSTLYLWGKGSGDSEYIDWTLSGTTRGEWEHIYVASDGTSSNPVAYQNGSSLAVNTDTWDGAVDDPQSSGSDVVATSDWVGSGENRLYDLGVWDDDVGISVSDLSKMFTRPDDYSTNLRRYYRLDVPGDGTYHAVALTDDGVEDQGSDGADPASLLNSPDWVVDGPSPALLPSVSTSATIKARPQTSLSITTSTSMSAGLVVGLKASIVARMLAFLKSKTYLYPATWPVTTSMTATPKARFQSGLSVSVSATVSIKPAVGLKITTSTSMTMGTKKTIKVGWPDMSSGLPFIVTSMEATPTARQYVSLACLPSTNMRTHLTSRYPVRLELSTSCAFSATPKSRIHRGLLITARTGVSIATGSSNSVLLRGGARRGIRRGTARGVG